MPSKDDIQTDEGTNLLPVDEGANVLTPEVAAAIKTIKEAITSAEGEGEPGLPRIQLIIGELEDAVFSNAAAVVARSRPADGEVPQAVMLFGARNLEVLARALKGTNTLASGLRFVLLEAPEELVVAHAAAADDLAGLASNEELSREGATALAVCREIAEAGGFGGRIKSREGVGSGDVDAEKAS